MDIPLDATRHRRMAERCLAMAAAEVDPGRAEAFRLKAAELLDLAQQLEREADQAAFDASAG